MKSTPTNLKSLPVDELADVKAWAGDVAEFETWAAEIAQPFDDAPAFDLASNPEIDTRAKLERDRAHLRRATRRLFVDFRASPDAYRHLRRLPREGESLHMVISGKYALFELVPALLERHKREHIAELYLLTLGFSKNNGADLCAMIDTKHIRRCTLICSYYFEKTSKGIYEAVVPELLKRRQRVKALRTHCKMIVVRMSGGARYVCESSANLRSCVNIEQAVLTRCERLHRFHRRWIESIMKPPAKGAKSAA